MSDLAEIIDTLWLHATDEEDPWTVDQAWAMIRPFGDAALKAIVWAVQQDDLNLRLLGLRLLRQYDPPAFASLPAVAECIGSEERLIRLAAIETAGLMRHGAASVIPRIQPHLDSDDEVERVIAAGNLLRITKSGLALAVLKESMASGSAGAAMFASYYLREGEWNDKPPEDWW